ncbi:hypothetical protein N9B73_00705 [Verrucomicrobiales bacterium]|jgi:hypothetical protein|nr:hypothetical protein [Verrucomicrobiales bacterium]
MDDIPVVPLAMVIIAFLSWLRSRFKEASELRRERSEAKAEVSRARGTTGPAKPAYQRHNRDEPLRRAPVRDIAEEAVPKTFRELFDEINSQKEVTSSMTPPPLPPSGPKPKVEPEEEAWGDGDGFGAYAEVPKSTNVAPKKRKPANKEGKHSLAKALSDGNQLSNALILREILGPPKALSNKFGRR